NPDLMAQIENKAREVKGLPLLAALPVATELASTESDQSEEKKSKSKKSSSKSEVKQEDSQQAALELD
ncbi:MAG: hypothetical protein R3264_14850, partial [Anaerolineae bacterium]|nr:hypothetical protein [Anaerolineae bacterium]